jgi:ubiquinone/menaquinone biosynthesis C-methylase UbiE
MKNNSDWRERINKKPVAPSQTAPSKASPQIKKEKTSWNSVAKWYDTLLEGSADSYQEKVILPNILRIVAPKKSMNILDIACGQGYFSRAFAEKGAVVAACDIAPELIEIARNTSPKSISFATTPADDLSFKDGNSVDTAVIVLAIQNIENIVGVFNEAYRTLKPGGKLVLVLNHPAFRIVGGSSWGWDAGPQRQYRRIDSYMSDSQHKIDMTPAKDRQIRKKFTISFHRPLQAYFKALNKAGFAVARLEEWISHKESQPGPRAEEENRMRKEIPLFICLEAVKLR